MDVVESQWWIVDLPPEWSAEQDEDTIIISDEDGVGEIAITTLEKEVGLVTDTELLEYAQEVIDTFSLVAEPVSVADLSGYYFSYIDEGDAVRDWYLRCDNLLILITYSCAYDNAGLDDASVNEILSTIFIKDGDDE